MESKFDKDTMEKAHEWARKLCYYAGAEEVFCQDFWKRLCEDDDILEEFIYYLEHQDFLYKVKIEGYGLVDLMVFQIDHFKAVLDQNVADMRHNKDKMLLMAFHSLLLMRKNPEPFLQEMETETGTDYPGKY